MPNFMVTVYGFRHWDWPSDYSHKTIFKTLDEAKGYKKAQENNEKVYRADITETNLEKIPAEKYDYKDYR